MRGLLTKDFLTIKKKYGIVRIIMDIAIIAVLMLTLEGTGTIYISFLLIPIEVMSMIITLTTCDEQWKWGKYAISLPVSKRQIVKSRYAFAAIMSLLGFLIALSVNTLTYFFFPNYAYGFYLFIACSSFSVTLLFLSIVLPSNYSLGVNAGFAVMFIFVVLLVALGMWTKITGGAIMSFVVDHFEICIGIAFGSVIILWLLSYNLSVAFFKRKHI